ncbi:cupin domain-containing protein [Streptomonospora salina]|uniref:Quercetin dioxygenase-like cupin family protein n=1 Tax=Streptomonospora salina TaxID=104205 RepID=A0A841EAJ1_9ACTN|nr:cupin domain-containing protein [Streptomonospora salina]MBB5996481.1 quercetin dioxygenase-like cupin family protein [Streptomonospora salina]
MTGPTPSQSPDPPPIPPDDPQRRLTVAHPESDGLQRVALAGGRYTILVPGARTGGRYCLIDMRIPPGGGPPPHRHDFEEMFTVVYGRIRFTFRGEDVSVGAGETVNIPANAPHFFRNAAPEPARMLCMCTPAGQDEFFLQVGSPIDGAAPGEAAEAPQGAGRPRAAELAARYRTELL